jgi:uncharacterized membrane protein
MTMNNRTIGIIATVLTSLLCGCAAIIACSFGVLGAAGIPFETTVNGQTNSQPMPAALGYVLLCLSVIFIVIPIAVGFFTLRKKPEVPASNEPIPPAS